MVLAVLEARGLISWLRVSFMASDMTGQGELRESLHSVVRDFEIGTRRYMKDGW